MKRYVWLLIMLLPALVFAAPGDKITVGGMALPLSADSVTDGATNKTFTATEKAKLATLDATQLRDRSTHTGTQPATTIATDDTHQFASTAEKSAWNAKQDALGFTPLSPSNNLSDLASPATARAALGLGNVSNTADSDKPVSAAMQEALNAKAPLAAPTFTDSVTAPSFNSNAADGYHYVLPYNSTAFAGTPSVGMIQTTPTGPQWYTGSAWEAIGSGGGGTWGSITGTLSAQTDLQTALNAKASTGYVDTAIAGVTAGNIPFVSDTTPPSAENTINYSRSDHKFRFRYPGGNVYASAAMTLETAADTTPAAFAFTDETDVAMSTTQTATPVQITGINYPTAVTATGGTAAICTGATVGTCGKFSASPGNIALNQYVSAQHTSSASNSTAVDTVVTIDGVSDTFTSTTVAGSACSETPGSDVTAAGTIWNAENVYRAATVFNDTSSRSICKIGFYVNSVTGSPTGNYTVRIYNLGASNELGALVAESTTSLTASQLTSSAYNYFDFSGATLSANTSYAVVFWNSASSAEWAENYVNLQVTTTVSGSDTNQASAKWQTSGAISGTMPTFPHVSGTWTKARIFYVQ